ncbi:HD-GYP domain-containing protein [Roseomonas aeriglobus]|nr:HD-GYP domain-containing protein [Roseomonas aeriglobus]
MRVEIERLRPGVFIESIEGSWLSSPFWKKRFLLESVSDIDRLRAAGISGVTIDTTKGLGPAPLPVAGPVEDILDDRTVLPIAPAIETEPAPIVRRRRRSAARVTEIDRAQETVQKSKEAVTAMFGEARMGQAIKVEAVEPLVDEIAASVARDPSAMIKVTRLKHKNEYTYLHSVAVCALMINLARHIGLPEEDHRAIGMAGLLHDIGKMAIPEDVLEKPGRLDDDEVVVVRSHPEKGHAILIDSPEVSAMALDVCLHHHERVDGKGYPFGLTADQLNLHARMGAICDVYDAITSNRPYKRAWSANDSLARMLQWEGHFDEDLLDAFIASIGIQPTGGLVRLQSNRLGIVLEGNLDEPTRPLVRAFYDIPTQRFVEQEDIVTASADDRIIRAEKAPYWFGEGWEAVCKAVLAGEVPTSQHSPARPYAAMPQQRRAPRVTVPAAVGGED